LYLLGPSESSFRPLNLSESTSLAKGIFLLLVNFQKEMVQLSCQLIFINFFGPFCHFFYPLCHFFWLENHLNPFLSFLFDVMRHFSFFFGNVLEDRSL
jgi:hypothetical protein